jgi:hypothetical protein
MMLVNQKTRLESIQNGVEKQSYWKLTRKWDLNSQDCLLEGQKLNPRICTSCPLLCTAKIDRAWGWARQICYLHVCLL